MRFVVTKFSGVRFGDGDRFVGEGGAADGAEGFVADDQAMADAETVADGFKGAPFAEFGALAVADVDGGGTMVAGGESGADGRSPCLR